MENFLTLHGANPENLYRIFDIKKPEKILDFSTNTNILSWPDIKINLKKTASNYPDPECRRLRELISEREKINPEKILFTNGTNEALFLLASFLKGNTAVFNPCYTEYKRAFRNAENVFNIDGAGAFENFIIANPNNPTGKFVKNLSYYIKKFPKTLFIIDEAYIDFLLNQERERLFIFENVILLRSLTKIFHLSGVRIGYVIADEKIISELKNLQPSWSVNAVAQELAYKFLSDKDFYEKSREFYTKNTPEFINSLKKSNFEVINTSVNFFLIKVENDIEIIKSLLKSGIVVRHTRNFLGLDGKYIRAATRFKRENEFFIEKLKILRNLHQDYFRLNLQ